MQPQPENLSGWAVFAIVFFFLFCLFFIFFVLYRILAGPSNVSIRKLINGKTINPSTLKDIHISEFGGRLTFKKFSYPLQYYNDGYRQILNAYLSTILGEIRNIPDCHGKVDYLACKGASIEYVRLFLGIALIVLLSAALWIWDSPYIDWAFNSVFLAGIIFARGKNWKLSDDIIQFRNGRIELKHITGIKLSIPPKKLYFEMELTTMTGKVISRDSKLSRLLPIISLVNAHNSDGSILNV